LRHHPDVGRFGLPALFSILTAAFTVIAFAGATHGRWVIAIAAVAIAAWMATVAWAALKRSRRTKP